MTDQEARFSGEGTANKLVRATLPLAHDPKWVKDRIIVAEQMLRNGSPLHFHEVNLWIIALAIALQAAQVEIERLKDIAKIL